MPEPDFEAVRRIFDRLTLVTAGEPLLDGLAAVQDLYCALICVACDTQAEAAELATRMHRDVDATIDKNYEWYRAHRSEQPNAPAGRA